VNHIEELSQALVLLERGYEMAKADISRQLPDVDPLIVKDTTGRYILLESLIVIIQARMTLAQMGNDT